ncbi:MAG TPA: hypothetical protein VFV34_18775 [Blastocatellia bacterium]|nr:hypothetical protein [Blastocatellia bacterium]
MKYRAVSFIAVAIIIGWAIGSTVFAAQDSVDIVAVAQKRDDKDPKKKDPPGPPVVRDKREKDRGKEPPPKPPRKPGS